MPITIDDDALHEWARGNGYVRSDVLDQIGELLEASRQHRVAARVMDERRDEALAALADQPDTLGVALLEQPEDLKPDITRKELETAFRSLIDFYTPRDRPSAEAVPIGVGAGKALLNSFGATGISGITEDRFVDFMARINTKHRYPTAANFIASLKL